MFLFGRNNADVALFCDMAIKMSYRFKAVAFKDLTDLDKALVADLVLALRTSSNCYYHSDSGWFAYSSPRN